MTNFYTDNKNLKFHLSHPLMKKIVSLKEQNFVDKDKYDYAPFDYDDAVDSYDKVLEIIGEISANILDQNSESIDTEEPTLVNNRVKYARGTQENYDALVKAGLIGMSLPRKYNGLNFPIVPYVMSEEIISRADAGFANIWGLQDCAETIHEFGSEEQKNEYLPRFNKGATASMDLTEPDAGSDLQAVILKAKYDEKRGTWLLNGVKRFITNGDADIGLVLARSEEGTKDARGLSLFIFENKRNENFKVRRIENKLGIHGSPTCELIFTDAPAQLVGERRMGLIKYVMSLMNSARLGVGAQSVGIAEAAFREAYKYATEREQFGKKIIQFPAVYEMLSNMRAKTDAIRSMLYETARFVDVYKSYVFIMKQRKLEPEERKEMKYYQRYADLFTPLLKLFASEYCNQIAYDAIQIHGGTGYMKDFPIERIARDARITSIYEGTSQLQVVAAIRGVANGAYIKKINEYSKIDVKPELSFLKQCLNDMTKQYETTAAKVYEIKDNEYLNFHSRRLVEMAGNIIIGYLLLLDTNRDEDYKQSAEIFIIKAKSENIEKANYISDFKLENLKAFKF